MKGTRPLDNDEIRRVSSCFRGTFSARNRGLFMLGVSTGGRISELLSLRIGDVYQNGTLGKFAKKYRRRNSPFRIEKRFGSLTGSCFLLSHFLELLIKKSLYILCPNIPWLSSE